MPPVAVRILHAAPGAASGPLTRWVADALATLADHHRAGFAAAGARDVAIVGGPPDDRSFGDRLRELVADVGSGGLVVLGSGSIPLATAGDRRALVAAAAGEARRALANNRYSSDVVAISRVEALPAIPDLPGDNALPRWLEEVAGYEVDDLRRRWRLAIDIDGPLDLVLIGAGERAAAGGDLSLLESRIDALRAVASDPRAELLVTGRTSSATLAWLERHTAARTRAWVEERGLRAASRLAQGTAAGGRPSVASRRDRPPGSVLGILLDRDGPGSLGDHLARFADAAIVDSRVLLAHRVGADETGWPAAEDRFASDLLLAEGIADPWLREFTTSAAAASIPVLLGGHTLVGPGVRLVIGGARGQTPWRRPRAEARTRPGPRRGRAGRGPRGADPRGDRTRRPDHLRALHGPRAVRPRRRLLPGEAARPGRDGDFLTAPEAHPIFGAALARAARTLGPSRPSGALRPS